MAPSSDPPVPRNQRPVPRLAWAVAIAADAFQIIAVPLFFAGWFSPLNDVLDVIVSIVLVWKLGWHPALLPALVAELVPGLDLVPTWTAAVGIVALTRRYQVTHRATTTPAAPTSSHAEVLEDPPSPPRDPDGGASR